MEVILYATAWGPRFGGLNAFNRHVALSLANRIGRRGSVFCVTGPSDSAARAEAAGAGVTLVEVPLPPDANPFPTEGLDPVAGALKRAGVGPNALHIGHDVVTGEVALALRDVLGGRAMLVHHMSYEAYQSVKAAPAERTREKVAAQRRLFGRADRLAAVGPLLTRCLRDLTGRDDVLDLTPGLDVVENRSSDAALRIITYGRFDLANAVIKQAPLVAAGYGRAAGTGNTGQAQLLVIGLDPGDAAHEQELKALSDAAAGRLTNILPLPFLADPAEVRAELARCNVACVVSFHEGFGLTAWEAIGAAVPLVITRNSGVYQLVANRLGRAGTGCLFGVDVEGRREAPYHTAADVESVSKAIAEIAHDLPSAKRDAERLREMIRTSGPATWAEAADAILAADGWAPYVRGPPAIPPTPPMLLVSSSAKNPVADCAEVTIGFTQGSTVDNFDVLPEVRFGTVDLVTAQGRVAVGVRRATLRLGLTGCAINAGARLGDDAERSPNVAARPGNTWDMRGPQEDGVLSRKVLGDERLCGVTLTAPVAELALRLTCRRRDLRFEHEHALSALLGGAQNKVIDLFLARCISDSDGDPLLGTAELRIEKPET